jgi:type I restriction enzyme S subunit
MKEPLRTSLYSPKWPLVKAKQVVSINHGSDPKLDGAIPVYGSGSECVKTCGEYKVGPAVLLGRKGTLNAPRYVTGKYWNVDTAFDVKVRDESTFSLRFFYYLACCFDYGRYSTQTALPSMTQAAYANMQIPFPAIEIQRKIAVYLDSACSAIDSLIASKQSLLEKLEEYRKAVITKAVTKGLDQSEELKDSGIPWIGEIPKEANICRLKFFSYMKGRIGWQGLKSNDFIDNGPYCVTGTDFVDGKINWSTCYHVSEERYEMDKSIQLQVGDLLVTKDGTIGKLAKVTELPGKACLNSHLLIIRPTENKFSNEYLYYVMLSDVFVNYYRYTSTGSIMESLSQEKTGDFSFPLHDLPTQNRIVQYLDNQCASIDRAVLTVKEAIAHLQEYRTSLITAAVTGKIDVADI